MADSEHLLRVYHRADRRTREHMWYRLIDLRRDFDVIELRDRDKSADLTDYKQPATAKQKGK